VLKSEAPAELLIGFAKTLDWANRLCYFGTGASRESISHLFANQAINTLINYGSRPYSEIRSIVADTLGQSAPIETSIELQVCEAVNARHGADILVTDNYHEITEFFIAWLRSNPPSPFDNWIWDSQRTLAIRGRDEEFRRDMVATYSAMTAQMPDQGLQVVMFTHQDAGVWADLGGILWAAGLEVRSAWNIATETVKPSGKGNFVQGTVCLALRKRTRVANVRRMEIEAEIEESVKEQIRLLSEIDAAWSGEALYTDGDLTLAAYAAALRVVTSYTSIDRQALDRDLYRKLRTNEKTLIRDLVDYAARTANAMLVPSDFPKGLWRDLDPASRFYVRMADMESRGAVKFADFQNFAKSFAYSEYTSVMESTAANEPRLAAPSELRAQMLDGTEFSSTILRQVLFAIWKTIESNSPKVGVTILRTEFAADYWTRRQTFVDFAVYLAAKFKDIRPVDSNAAYELAESLKLDRI
jgi:putative DNA methylase